jgi:hypothetical protein
MSVTERATQPRTVDLWPQHYSPRNCVILSVSGASEVAGYREWQAFGRQVRKGEKGIPLLAPVTQKDKETGETRVVNMKTTTVFDVTQTDEA